MLQNLNGSFSINASTKMPLPVCVSSDGTMAVVCNVAGNNLVFRKWSEHRK